MSGSDKKSEKIYKLSMKYIITTLQQDIKKYYNWKTIYQDTFDHRPHFDNLIVALLLTFRQIMINKH